MPLMHRVYIGHIRIMFTVALLYTMSTFMYHVYIGLLCIMFTLASYVSFSYRLLMYHVFIGLLCPMFTSASHASSLPESLLHHVFKDLLWQWQWQWNNLYCQVTYKSCTESYDKNKMSDKTIIHEIYRTWQRGCEAIMAYVPQYQSYQRYCLIFGVQSRNSAECWNSFYLMLFLSCTCMSISVSQEEHICTYIYTSLYKFNMITTDALMHQNVAESCKYVIVWKQEQSLDTFFNKPIAQFESTLSRT